MTWCIGGRSTACWRPSEARAGDGRRRPRHPERSEGSLRPCERRPGLTRTTHPILRPPQDDTPHHHPPPPLFQFRLDATQGAARAGTLTLPHGPVKTPAFMPVGTHGVVRGLGAQDVSRTGAQIILGNTYHLHLRPGEDVIRDMGGLNRFTTWSRPMLTDSGGFQVFSLEGLRRVGEDGVEFQSHVDGTYRTPTPERPMEIQWALGAHVAMAFDPVVPRQRALE